MGNFAPLGSPHPTSPGSSHISWWGSLWVYWEVVFVQPQLPNLKNGKRYHWNSIAAGGGSINSFSRLGKARPPTVDRPGRGPPGRARPFRCRAAPAQGYRGAGGAAPRRALAQAKGQARSARGPLPPRPAPGNPAPRRRRLRPAPPRPPRPQGAQKRGLPLPRLFPAQPGSRLSRLSIRLQSTSQPRPCQPRGRAGAAGGRPRGRGNGGGRRPSSLPRGAGGSGGPARLPRGSARPTGRGAGEAVTSGLRPGEARGGPAGKAARPRLPGCARAVLLGRNARLRPRPRPAGAAPSAGATAALHRDRRPHLQR